VEKLLQLNAIVVSGDLNEPPISSPQLTHVKLDVTSWQQLSDFFKKANDLHGRIDHAFANAGIGPTTSYLDEDFDKAGNLLEPKTRTLDVNLKACINTVYLALHYMKRQKNGGSVVITASASSIQGFRAADYGVAKHGVYGLMRNLAVQLHPELPIRINCLAPMWTATGMVHGKDMNKALGVTIQTAQTVADSAILLMADESRHGQCIYSDAGKYWEIEQGLLVKAARQLTMTGGTLEEGIVKAAANPGTYAGQDIET